jgi:hypothetical protein
MENLLCAPVNSHVGGHRDGWELTSGYTARISASILCKKFCFDERAFNFRCESNVNLPLCELQLNRRIKAHHVECKRVAIAAHKINLAVTS